MRRIPCLLVALTTLVASGSVLANKKSDLLTSTLRAYANAIRWEGFQSAEVFIDPKVLKTHPPTSLDMARYAQVRVSDYDEGSGPVPVGENEVRQVVQIGLINVNTQSERTIADHQLWRYDPDNKHWWLESGLPDITQPSITPQE